jgi:RNAse (barnase) inhibitor barstar
VALNHHRHRGLPDDPPGAVYELDGRHVVDVDSFYCALGEAVNGPGGYFGWNLDAVVDCARGRWGATPPFTLVWRHADVSEPHLSKTRVREDTLFECVLGILDDHGIDVDLR